MYVGTKTDSITISSPGPMRSSSNEDDLIVTIEEGDIIYDSLVALQYTGG